MYTHHVFSVGPAVPDSVKTVADFFAWAKANPDKAAYGGSAPGIQDLLGGQIASFFGPTGDVLTRSRTGKVRVLGTSGAERSAFLPEVPTLREQGVSVALREWYAFFMPVRAGADAAQRAAAALKPVLAGREVVEFARQFGLEAQASAPRELADLLKKDSGEWGGLVKQTGFTAESG